MTTYIYLLRHAAYENPQHVFHARLPGFPLSQEGKRQAARLAEALRTKPIAAVYASPLTRARETAHAIARIHGLVLRTDDRLLDIKTPLQGKPIAYMESIHWNFYRPEFIRAGGERLREIFQRMDDCIKQMSRKHQGQHIVLVSHGDPIMAIKIKYLGGQLRSRKPILPYVSVASGYTMTIDSKQNIRAFLPLDEALLL